MTDEQVFLDRENARHDLELAMRIVRRAGYTISEIPIEKVGDADTLSHEKVDVPFMSFSNSEIQNMGEILGTYIKCRICGEMHIIECGKVKKEDGTFVESDALQFTKCADGAMYLVGLYGKKINKWG